MGSNQSDGLHICVRCGHGNQEVASFCVECGFDLNSALQLDYDSYRDVSRGSLTETEADVLPSSANETITGIPVTSEPASAGAVMGSDQVDAQGELAGSSPNPSSGRRAGAPVESIVKPGPTPPTTPELKLEPIAFDSLPDDPFSPSAQAPADAPKSRPVHENLRSGITTYVDAPQRGFRRPNAAGSGSPILKHLFVGLVIGIVLLGLALILTR